MKYFRKWKCAENAWSAWKSKENTTKSKVFRMVDSASLLIPGTGKMLNPGSSRENFSNPSLVKKFSRNFSRKFSSKIFDEKIFNPYLGARNYSKSVFSFQIRADFFLIGLTELIAKRISDWEFIDFLFFILARRSD